MKTVLFAVLTLVSTNAYADGFNCTSERDHLNVKVFHNTQASEGTRNAAVMVVSDTFVREGNKTIARFLEVNGTLSNAGALYVADVDLRFNDSGRKGEQIGGTKLGQLKNIILDVDFSYSNPVHSGDEMPALLKLIKRNGDTIGLSMICQRYLKN